MDIIIILVMMFISLFIVIHSLWLNYFKKPKCDFLSKFDKGYSNIIIREDDILGRRECYVGIDDPGLDCTDFAHPAYFRGEDHGVNMIIKRINTLLNSKDNKSGVSNCPELDKLYMRLIELRDK